MLDHQDWNTIIIKKHNKDNKVKVTKEKHKDSERNKIRNSIENKADNDELKHKKVTLKISSIFIKRRNELKLTQKELAQKINLPVTIINDIESGKSIYNHQHIQKIKRGLNIY